MCGLAVCNDLKRSGVIFPKSLLALMLQREACQVYV